MHIIELNSLKKIRIILLPFNPRYASTITSLKKKASALLLLIWF